MKVVVTNAHKNPIIFECPWMFAEDEEAYVNMKPKESIMIDIPKYAGDITGDPQEVIEIGFRAPTPEGVVEFFIDVLREASGPECLYSMEINPYEG